MLRHVFSTTKTLNAGRKLYRELSKQYHPDLGGTDDQMKEINLSYEDFLSRVMSDYVAEFTADKDYDIDSEIFAEMLKKVIHFNMDIEIIGFWIYCFNSFGYKDQLAELGFWFSKKHKAWVYSGRKKINVRTRSSTNDIRNTHGAHTVKEKEDYEKIAG